MIQNKIEPRERINGRHLQRYIGTQIKLIGKVLLVNVDGIKMKTFDGVCVHVIMNQSLLEQKPLAEYDIVEISGRPQGKTALFCEDYIVFLPHQTENFGKIIVWNISRYAAPVMVSSKKKGPIKPCPDNTW